MLESVWNDIQMPEFPKLEHDIQTDVLIVGGGMAGLLTAYMLKQHGIDCLLVEAGHLCGGITRNTTAKITSQHGLIYHKLMKKFGADTARLYWEANEAALKRYEQYAQGIDCDFEIKDHYVFSLDSSEKLEKELEVLQKLRIPGEYVQKLQLPFSTSGAVRFPQQAQFHPLKFAAAISAGLPIYEQTPVRSFEGNTAVTDRGKIRASKIVIATHFPIINKHGSYFLKQFQNRSYVLAAEGAKQVDGMYLDEAEQGLSLRSSGKFLLVGSGGHRTGKKGAAWETAEAFLKKYDPKATVRCRWAAQDCMSLDGIPYIGQYSRSTPYLYVATGFNKWGMTSSMAAASLLCDLIQDKGTLYAGVFSPSRSMFRPQLMVNALEATVNLLTPTAPRCPHLGCALKWNPREHTWDCPCHGSRFGEDGRLLDDPATGDLKQPYRGKKP